MPVMIASGSAQADIIHVGKTTHVRAVTRGTPFKEDADQYLKSQLDNIALFEAKIATTEATELSLRAQRDVEVSKCDALVGRVSDEIFNVCGRVANDPLHRLIFPNGVASWTTGPVPQRPVQLNMFAGLLEHNINPAISKEYATRTAAEIRAAAANLEAVNKLLEPVKAELRVLRTQRSGTVQQLHIQLARLKKHWKARGFTEVQIHEIIPASARPSAPAAPAEAAVTEPLVSVPPLPSVAR